MIRSSVDTRVALRASHSRLCSAPWEIRQYCPQYTGALQLSHSTSSSCSAESAAAHRAHVRADPVGGGGGVRTCSRPRAWPKTHESEAYIMYVGRGAAEGRSHRAEVVVPLLVGPTALARTQCWGVFAEGVALLVGLPAPARTQCGSGVFAEVVPLPPRRFAQVPVVQLAADCILVPRRGATRRAALSAAGSRGGGS